jgi:hypothetical protein
MLDRYSLLKLNRSSNSYKASESGGVMVYYSDSYNSFYHWDVNGENCEMLALVANCGKLTCGLVVDYRSTIASNLNAFLDQLDKTLNYALTVPRLNRIFVCGDCNVNLLGSGVTREFLALQLFLNKFSLVQLVKCPTRFPSNSLLDVHAVAIWGSAFRDRSPAA